MKRIRIIGLCLVAAFAMSAIAATGASAANPEYGRCIKTTTGVKGKYSSATCTVLAKEVKTEKYEWYAAFGSAKPLVLKKFTTKLKPAAVTKATLETRAGTKVICTGLEGAGEYTGNKAVLITKTTFTGCESGGIKCNTTGSPTGKIEIAPLSGELGLITKVSPSTKDKIGNVLFPQGGSPTSGSQVAEWQCASLVVKVRNSVISPVTSNSMKLAATVKFTGAKGIQKPLKFESGPNTYLESKFGSTAPFEQSQQTATTIQTNEEKVEIRSL